MTFNTYEKNAFNKVSKSMSFFEKLLEISIEIDYTLAFVRRMDEFCMFLTIFVVINNFYMKTSDFQNDYGCIFVILNNHIMNIMNEKILIETRNEIRCHFENAKYAYHLKSSVKFRGVRSFYSVSMFYSRCV